MTLRVVLAGQRSFGRAALQALDRVPGVEVALVVSPATDTDALTSYAFAQGHGWKDRITPEAVSHVRADLIVAAHSHDFIGRKTRAATKLGAVGYHPSLLPRHRGRDAVEWTVRMGDPVAGGSVYWFTDSVDGGPVARQDWCHVRRDEGASDLWRDQLFPMGVRLLVEVVEEVRDGVLRQVPQDERYATWEPAITGQRLHRPELPEIGSGPAGYRVVATSGRLETTDTPGGHSAQG